MGMTSYGATRSLLARSVFTAITLLVASWPCFAQDSAREPQRTEPGGLAAAFDEIGRTWIERQVGDRRKALDDLLRDLAEDVEASALPADAESLQSLVEPGVRPERSLREIVRYETRLAGTEILPGAQLSGATDLKSAASLAQQRARQAVIDYLADTSLGRSVGRFVFFNQDTAAEATRSRLIPLVKPKLRYRSREVGISLVWRF